MTFLILYFYAGERSWPNVAARIATFLQQSSCEPDTFLSRFNQSPPFDPKTTDSDFVLEQPLHIRLKLSSWPRHQLTPACYQANKHIRLGEPRCLSPLFMEIIPKYQRRAVRAVVKVIYCSWVNADSRAPCPPWLVTWSEPNNCLHIPAECTRWPPRFRAHPPLAAVCISSGPARSDPPITDSRGRLPRGPSSFLGRVRRLVRVSAVLVLLAV